MYVASVTESEHRITLDTMVDLHNALVGDPTADPRGILADAGFSRAPDASAASLHRLAARVEALEPFLAGLPELETDEASARITEELTELPITPSIVDHGGVGPHVHWTPPTARFDDQVMADLMMALAHEDLRQRHDPLRHLRRLRLLAAVLRRHPEPIEALLLGPSVRQPDPHGRSPPASIGRFVLNVIRRDRHASGMLRPQRGCTHHGHPPPEPRGPLRP